MKPNPTYGSPNAYLEKDDRFELINAPGYSSQSDRIRYTTILKDTGLERDFVILVCSSMLDKKNIFQLFIVASRAKCRVYLVAKGSDGS